MVTFGGGQKAGFGRKDQANSRAGERRTTGGIRPVDPMVSEMKNRDPISRRTQNQLQSSRQNFLSSKMADFGMAGPGYQRSAEIKERVHDEGNKRIYEGYICNICCNSALNHAKCCANQEENRRNRMMDEMMIKNDLNAVENDRKRRQRMKEALKNDQQNDLLRAQIKKEEEQRMKEEENAREREKFERANQQMRRAANQRNNQDVGYKRELENQIQDNQRRRQENQQKELEEIRRAQGLPIGNYHPDHKEELKRTLEEQIAERKKTQEQQKLSEKEKELRALEKMKRRFENMPNERQAQREEERKFANQLLGQINENEVKRRRDREREELELQRAQGLRIGEYNPIDQEALRKSLEDQIKNKEAALNQEKAQNLEYERNLLNKLEKRNVEARIRDLENNSNLKQHAKDQMTQEYLNYLNSKEQQRLAEKDDNRRYIEGLSQKDRELLEAEQRRRREQKGEMKDALLGQMDEKRRVQEGIKEMERREGRKRGVRSNRPRLSDIDPLLQKEKQELTDQYFNALTEKEQRRLAQKRDDEKYMNRLIQEAKMEIEAENQKNKNMRNELRGGLEKQMKERAEKKRREEKERLKPGFKRSATGRIREFIKCGNCERLIKK